MYLYYERTVVIPIRLDKLLSVTGTLSRSDAKRAIRAGRIRINGAVAKSADAQLDPETDKVSLDGRDIVYRKYTYIMLNKPEGYVSATDDKREKTVLDLLPEELSKLDLFPCGRLDKYTLGLMLITDDGDLAHRLLAPKSHVSKSYRFGARDTVSKNDIEMLENGVRIEGGYLTKPCKVVLDENDATAGVITLTEGKYHQIKQMFDAVSNKITYLERITFGPLSLDPALERGEWRFLNEDEENQLRAHSSTEQF